MYYGVYTVLVYCCTVVLVYCVLVLVYWCTGTGVLVYCVLVYRCTGIGVLVYCVLCGFCLGAGFNCFIASTFLRIDNREYRKEFRDCTLLSSIISI